MLDLKLGIINVDKRNMYKTYTSTWEAQGILKDGCSITNPIITIQADASTIARYNYAEIPVFGRKYFITNIVSLSASLVEVHMHCDVLTTYNNQMDLCTGFVTRNEKLVNKMVNDTQKVLQCNPAISTIPFSNPSNNQGFTYCLITTGD